MKKEKHIVEQALSGTGITINGKKPHDPQVHNEDLYTAAFSRRAR